MLFILGIHRDQTRQKNSTLLSYNVLNILNKQLKSQFNIDDLQW